MATLADFFRLRGFRVSTRADSRFSAAMRVDMEKGTYALADLHLQAAHR